MALHADAAARRARWATAPLVGAVAAQQAAPVSPPRPAEPQRSPHSVSELVDAVKGEPAKRQLSALELKRLRNRECMRRSRLRKMGEVSAMKAQIAELEETLRRLQVKKSEAMAAATVAVAGDSDALANASASRLIDALQRENFRLRDEVREKDKFRDVIAPLLEQEEQRIILDEQQRVREELYTDQFSWLRHVVPLLGLKSMAAADVAALVRESCDEILSSARRADVSIENPNRVLGWSDKRIVDDHYVHFMFGKDFAHQSVEEVTMKSWETSSDLDKINAFQPRQQHMVCLQRWGDDAIVLARNLNVPQRCSDGSELERNYCSVFLVFRLQTPTGFVVGTKTLMHSKVQEALMLAGEYRVTYVDLCYGLLFTPLSPASPVGCNVRFGGRGGNGTRVYAQVCAMDVLLATLRWENHCIAPLNRLTTSAMR